MDNKKDNKDVNYLNTKKEKGELMKNYKQDDLVNRECGGDCDFFLEILKNSQEIILFSVDQKYRYQFFNTRYRELMEAQWEKTIQVGESILDVGKQEDNQLKRILANVLAGEKLSYSETYQDKSTGQVMDWSNRFSPMYDKGGKISGVICIGIDETEKNQVKKELFEERKNLKLSKMLGYYDHLTGLYNRRYFEDRLIDIDKQKNYPIAIITADINGLELINDSFGRAIGDEYILRTAEILKKSVVKGTLIARLASTQFVMVLTETDEKTVQALVNRMYKQLMEEKVDEVTGISVSFGWDTKNKEDQKIIGVFKNAEDRLYRAKLKEGVSMKSKTIKRVLEALFDKKKGEKEHSKHVGEISGKIARYMTTDPVFIEQTIRAGEMHDIGKITVDEKILNKLKNLEDNDWTDIKRHPERGFRLLTMVDEYQDIAEIVFQHQEQWDGKGYPRGLKGEEIMLQARIVSLAEAFEVMAKVMTKSELVAEMKKCAGSQFDPSLVDLVLEHLSEFL